MKARFSRLLATVPGACLLLLLCLGCAAESTPTTAPVLTATPSAQTPSPSLSGVPTATRARPPTATLTHTPSPQPPSATPVEPLAPTATPFPTAPTATVQANTVTPVATSTPAASGTPNGDCQVPTPEPGAAKVAGLRGKAWACPENYDCDEPAACGVSVLAGGEARTGDEASMVLWSTTAVYSLKESATLQFRDVTNVLQYVVLLLGRMFVGHDPDAPDEIVIETNDRIVRATDTIFLVQADFQDVRVLVFEGEATVTGRDGRSYAVPAGYSGSFDLAGGRDDLRQLGALDRLAFEEELKYWSERGIPWQKFEPPGSPVIPQPTTFTGPTRFSGPREFPGGPELPPSITLPE